MYTYVHMYNYACDHNILLSTQKGITPIKVAAMREQYGVVSLLKNKYGQEEPTPEEVVGYVLIYQLSLGMTVELI